METTASLALLRRQSAAEAGEGSAKKVKAAVGYDAQPAATATKKKTKTVMKTVPMDHVEFVLASKPTPRCKLPEPGRVSEERRRCSATFNKIVDSKNELLRSLQHKYRNDLTTKGRVEVEVELTDDES